MDRLLLQAVRRIRAGIEVEDSFRIIDGQLSHRLLRYFQTHGFSRADAEDLVQKTLAALYTNVTQLEHEEKFLAWLFTIARNTRHRAVKEKRRQDSLVAGGIELAEKLPDPNPASSGLEQQLDQRRLAEVSEAIENLPSQQRQCLMLRVQHELSYQDIADTLKLSVNTVRNHLAEAKKSLRRKFDSAFEEDLKL